MRDLVRLGDFDAVLALGVAGAQSASARSKKHNAHSHARRLFWRIGSERLWRYACLSLLSRQVGHLRGKEGFWLFGNVRRALRPTHLSSTLVTREPHQVSKLQSHSHDLLAPFVIPGGLARGHALEPARCRAVLGQDAVPGGVSARRPFVSSTEPASQRPLPPGFLRASCGSVIISSN